MEVILFHRVTCIGNIEIVSLFPSIIVSRSNILHERPNTRIELLDDIDDIFILEFLETRSIGRTPSIADLSHCSEYRSLRYNIILDRQSIIDYILHNMSSRYYSIPRSVMQRRIEFTREGQMDRSQFSLFRHMIHHKVSNNTDHQYSKFILSCLRREVGLITIIGLKNNLSHFSLLNTHSSKELLCIRFTKQNTRTRKSII